MFLELGAKVGILINPDELTVTVYRPHGKITLLTADDKLTVAEFARIQLRIKELTEFLHGTCHEE